MAVALYARFLVKGGNCRSCAQEQVVEERWRISVFGFLDEVGVFQRAGRREGELGGLSTFEVRRKAVIRSRRRGAGDGMVYFSMYGGSRPVQCVVELVITVL